MKHMKRRFLSRGSWKDPEKVGLYLSVCLVYVIGLLTFQKYTGLMEHGIARMEARALKNSEQYVWSSSEAQIWLATYGKRAKRDLEEEVNNPGPLFRHLLSANVSGINGTSYGNGTNETVVAVKAQDPLFPPDIFTPEQLKQGGVIVYIMGMIYMFVALAIVCDEFFVPALDVIIEVIGCSEDVAGATFMAAGGSAPELFTSVIGVFISFSDVGIGTIVGSAVFNILFVIGMCALFSKTVLHLTWWPLFRDCSFYSVSLITLILFFLDEKIAIWESALQLGIYAAYVIFMKFNVQSERFVKKILYKNKVTRVRSTDHLVPSHHSAAAMLAGVTGAAMSGVVASDGGRRTQSSMPVLHSGSHFRHGLLQLMIHTIDPLNDGKVDEKATQLHAIASLKVLLDATKPQDGVNGTTNPDGTITGIGDMAHDSGRASQGTEEEVRIAGAGGAAGADGAEGGNTDEIQPEPLDMAFPRGGLRKQITYLILFPIIFPLWLTLPDTRAQKSRKFYPVTFIGSIVWIAIFSYLMVWFSTVAGDTFGIPPEVMGLTFLAAGTSIPDLITSVIVARKGFGDMAVSSSVGSNIFDVTVGLPLPWFLYACVFNEAVPVSSEGMVCSITLLFTMLVLVFFSILIFGWKMTKGMGFSMFIFYFIFVAISLAFEYKFISCPI